MIIVKGSAETVIISRDSTETPRISGLWQFPLDRLLPWLSPGSAEPCLGAMLAPDAPCSSPDYTVWIEGCARIPRSSRINLPQSNSVDKVVPEVELDGWGCLHCSP